VGGLSLLFLLLGSERLAAVGPGAELILPLFPFCRLLDDPLDRALGQVGGELDVSDGGDRRGPFALIDLMLD
jgi:hypothetical protein